MKVTSNKKYRRAVFYNASGKRRVLCRRVFAGFLLALVVASCVFYLSLGTDPQFPALPLPQAASIPSAAETTPNALGKHFQVNTSYKLGKDEHYPDPKLFAAKRVLAAKKSSSSPLVFGFYVNWDPASLESLQANVGHLTHLVTEWLYLQNSAGGIIDESDERVIRLAREANVPILAQVSNYHDGWQSAELHRALRNRQRRHLLENNIRDRVVAHGFAGVNVDFEQVERRDRNQLTRFILELRGLMKDRGLLLTQCVPADPDRAYNLKRLAGLNDYMIPMLYDEHFESGRPGPVAAQKWFASQLAKTLASLPPNKTIVGIGNYGYDWIIGSHGGEEVRFADILSSAVAAKGAIEWDSESRNPVLRYRRSGQSHEVWYLDAVTALNEIRLLSPAGVRGTALWRLGSEDSAIWKVLTPKAWPSDNFQPEQLARLSANNSVNQYGKGEIIRLAATPRDGNRKVRVDNKEYVEEYEAYPAGFIVNTYGDGGPKRIALTFDDGPDPKYTPAILDILKAKGVSATFFVVGSHVEDSPGLIKRMYAEGHTIGNHTYSHPDVASSFKTRTRLELSLTQRLIGNALGRNATLYRPPYVADSELTASADLSALDSAQSYGYTMVGAKIDPRDWETRSSARIVQDVLRDKDLGNIIVLHDGGDDRSATVAALPKIIDALRAQNYSFVSVGDLLGETRDELMPSCSPLELGWAKVEGTYLLAKSKLELLIKALFILAIVLTLIRTLAYGILSIIQKRRAVRQSFDPDFAPPVSIIIAAYNEEGVIVQTIRSVLSNGYQGKFEVIAINDGSQDRTLEVLQGAFADDRRVRILTQENCGKAFALNLALLEAQYEILVMLDADTRFASGSIAKLVRHFADPKTAAVSANLKVGNSGKLLTRFQALEYMCGFNLDRRALDVLNAVAVIPGAASAWRKSAVMQVGGYSYDTLAEDTDLTICLRRSGHILRYDEEAIAFTETPEMIRDLVRQRLRWAFGTLQSAWKHRDAMFNPKYGTLAFVTLPSIWLFQMMLSLISPLAVLFILLGIWDGQGRIVAVYYLAFLLVEFFASALAYALEGENPADLALLPLQRILYPFLMQYVVSKSVLSALSGRMMGWSRARRAIVEQMPEPLLINSSAADITESLEANA